MSDAEDRWEAYYAVFDMAYDERKRLMRAGSLDEGFVDGALWGAGWAFAIIGMAQAISDGVRARRFSGEYWEYIGGDLWECWRDGVLVATRLGSSES